MICHERAWHPLYMLMKYMRKSYNTDCYRQHDISDECMYFLPHILNKY